MIAAHPAAFSLLFIAIALLAHVGSRLFTPFREIARITRKPSYFVMFAKDLEVGRLIKFRICNALKWAAIGLTVAALMNKFAQ
jgi:hypothetical protein